VLDGIIGTGFKNLVEDFPQRKFELRPENTARIKQVAIKSKKNSNAIDHF